ncbi:hypothetical protein [Mycobacterium sp.]|uniref:hypothetical protein n=1 Tax=Mycobacterium sp. TaxID=1785 RepID=UPI003340F7AF
MTQPNAMGMLEKLEIAAPKMAQNIGSDGKTFGPQSGSVMAGRLLRGILLAGLGTSYLGNSTP